MSSRNPNERAAGRAVSMDPVHPTARPESGQTGAATGAGQAGARSAQSRPAESQSRPAESQSRSAESRPAESGSRSNESLVAAEFGTPAVLEHHVVALSTPGGPRPLVMHTVDGDLELAPLSVQVWARAGRMTVVAQGGTELKFTVLCPDEHEDLELGEHWPPGEPEGAAKRFASAAARDVADAVTFPAWLARTTRNSGQRNATMHALVRRLRAASPETAVYVGQTYAFEHHHPERHHPYDHRGIVGHEGYPREL
jgi:hypothetical protein